MYEPWENTTWRLNRGRTAYGSAGWNRDTLTAALEPVVEWQRRHGVDSARIVLSEFGCDRRVPGAGDYLADVADLATGNGWHWAFYPFREDTWDGMDYELGTEPLAPELVAARDRGKWVTVPRAPNPVFGALERAIARGVAARD